MADFLHKPQNVIQVDDKAGNAYTIFSINHVQLASGNEVAVELDASVVSAKHIEEAGQTVVTITLDSTADTTLWTKTCSFPSESATGTYVICARHAGSAASVGGFKGDL
jgi:hypothetical protein